MEGLTGERRAALHDPCSVLAVTHPELFEFVARPVAVELAGTHTRGMTVVDERFVARNAEHTVDVAMRLNASGALALLSGALEIDP
jgi:inosine-uridine nucleoside N-ribohydrolase